MRTEWSVALVTMVLVVGCEGRRDPALDAERADSMYQTAMAEYAAGHLDKSISGLEKLLHSNPGNVSARFQLACLLQDHRKDALGALSNYREYVMQYPKGDKAAIVRERMAACERMFADELAAKFGVGGGATGEEVDRLRHDNETLRRDLADSRQVVEKLKADIEALRRENDRVRRMVIAGGEDEADAGTAVQTGQKVSIPDEKTLLEDDSGGVDRIKLSEDIDRLVVEEKGEREGSPFGKTVKPVVQAKEPEVPPEPAHEERPKTYTVQEGDTLYKLAIRFYGRRTAWQTIRDANKTVVSSDGRIRAGQVLKLP